jgi:Flp pilus assembly protein TadG
VLVVRLTAIHNGLPHKSSSCDRGAIAVLVALITPVAIVFLAFVVDIGNGFWHHRHLQLQADAAALNGAQEFLSGSCSDANVVGRAFEYSGIVSSQIVSNTNWTGAVTSYTDPGAPFNAQIGGTSPNKIFEAINSKTYLPSGNTVPPDPTTYSSNSPCGDSMVDVKMTETNLPWYFQAGGFQFINAHARAIWGVTGSGILPLAVDESQPQSVAAYFVDEQGNQVGNAIRLTEGQTLGQMGVTGTYAGDREWATNASVTIPVTTAGMSMVLALSGNPNEFNSNPSLSSACSAPLTVCWDGTGTGDHLVHIRGYSTTNQVESVSLPNAGSGCSSAAGPDSYFTNSTTGCSVMVQATMSFGANPPTGDKVYARIGNTCAQLAYNTSGAYSGTWTGSIATSAAGANQIDIVLDKSCNRTAAVAAGGTDAQSAFVANSGNASTIDAVVLGGSTGEASNSYPMCSTCTATFSVIADIGGSLQDAASTTDPVVALNFGSNNTASQTGLIECPPNSNSGSNLGATLVTGCPGTYAINGTVWGADPNCNFFNPGPGGSPSPPADCVQTKNGVANGPVDQGLFCRFVGGSQCVTASNPTGAPPVGKWYCPQPNTTSASNSGGNWGLFNPNDPPTDNLPADDDRVVTLFITPYDSFTGSGSTLVPILDVADFYVQGWSASGQNVDPCGSPAHGGNPATGDYASMPASAPRIWGHFIRYTSFGRHPIPPCPASGLGSCTVALTQ